MKIEAMKIEARWAKTPGNRETNHQAQHFTSSKDEMGKQYFLLWK